jgi:hypothetical protein
VRLQPAVKLFFVIVVCTVYFISFSQIGTFAYQSFVTEPNRFAEGTRIGSVSVSKLTKEEAVGVVQDKVNEWISLATVEMTFQEKKEDISTEFFTFQVEQSVEQAIDGQSSPLIVLFNEQAFTKQLEEMVAPLSISAMNLEKLKLDLINVAANLKMGKQAIDLATYFDEQQETENQTVSEATMANLGESQEEVAAWISKHSTIEIKGKSLFSLSGYFNNVNEPLSSKGRSIIASAIYQAILPTNFTIVERHTSRELPHEISLGYEAKVDKEKRDFRFYNPNTSTYKLQFKAINNGFHVTLTGLPFVYKYVVKVDDVEYFSPKTIIQYSPLLSPGERQKKQEGKRGLLVKVKKETYDEHNLLIKSEIIAEDFYPPSHNIEVRGLDLGVSLTNNETNPMNDQKEPSEEEQKNDSENQQPKSEQDEPSSDQLSETEQYEK